jgi:hypothetical protein
MRNLGKAVAATALAVSAFGVVATAPALAAEAQSSSPSSAPLAANGCYSGHIRTSGATTSYTECNQSGQSRVFGTVRDIDADGQCAYVTVTIGSYGNQWKACPKGHSTNYDTGLRGGSDAKVWLSER